MFNKSPNLVALLSAINIYVSIKCYVLQRGTLRLLALPGSKEFRTFVWCYVFSTKVFSVNSISQNDFGTDYMSQIDSGTNNIGQNDFGTIVQSILDDSLVRI